jgi:hypothetical protein
MRRIRSITLVRACEMVSRPCPKQHAVSSRYVELAQKTEDETIQWALGAFQHNGIEVRFRHRMRKPKLPRPERHILFAGQLL